ncbi:DUF692 domain-containing protein [Rufibacter glacialis]|uniref:DUF692 domain-containing protein n=1 Tax=Rufibacter glacialis TaxID=1259555 RepID=A0A5M8QC25_9BACT|nr:DUF692 domain-containing protein [Rufibacter glacialis]
MQEGRVEGLEWSFDTLFQQEQVPSWFLALLETYGREKRLIGHGVFFSLFSGKWSEHQEAWLRHLTQMSAAYGFDHVTEHFGFMTGKNFHHGAPLPIPYTAATLAIGRDRLARIQEAAQCPVGLENLAFSYTLEEVKRHGAFLEELVEPVNGFLILDLHNLYCQLHNFSLPLEALLPWYPLHRVREIHISGGSWQDSAVLPQRKVRRDTHDSAVPEEVFDLLSATMPLCPQLKYVVLEQLGTGLKSPEDKALFYQDFCRMETLVKQHNASTFPSLTAPNLFLPLAPGKLPAPVEDEALYQQQLLLSSILEESPSLTQAHQRLLASSLANTAWAIEHWEPHLLETALHLAQKWKKPDLSA